MGLKFANRVFCFPHLMFADDLTIFYHATPEETSSIQNILHTFCSWSGQQINLEKFSIHFSKNSSAELKKNVCSILNIKKVWS